jgi:hypothetical protein
MKKLVLTCLTALIMVLIKGQELSSQFIDSVAEKTSSYQTILLFAEFRDTIDAQTGDAYSQRISYYFDWMSKELRTIDVYNFNKIVKKRATEIAFRKQRHIPPSTHIVYTFFNYRLVKVKLLQSEKNCEACFREYYFTNEMISVKNEQSMDEQKRNFISEANFYLSRLQIAKIVNNTL